MRPQTITPKQLSKMPRAKPLAEVEKMNGHYKLTPEDAEQKRTVHVVSKAKKR